MSRNPHDLDDTLFDIDTSIAWLKQRIAQPPTWLSQGIPTDLTAFYKSELAAWKQERQLVLEQRSKLETT